MEMYRLTVISNGLLDGAKYDGTVADMESAAVVCLGMKKSFSIEKIDIPEEATSRNKLLMDRLA